MQLRMLDVNSAELTPTLMIVPRPRLTTVTPSPGTTVTAKALENGWLDGWNFLLGPSAYFQGQTVSFRECTVRGKNFPEVWQQPQKFNMFFCPEKIVFFYARRFFFLFWFGGFVFCCAACETPGL